MRGQTVWTQIPFNIHNDELKQLIEDHRIIDFKDKWCRGPPEMTIKQY
jgi:hypothetical protein